jgi:hypothetical protein
MLKSGTMKVTNLKTKRSYTLLRAKYQEMAAWCSHVKPVTIKIGGVSVKAYGLPSKSNYIYMMWQGWAHCVWAKDPKEFDFLKERSLKVADPGPAPKGPKAKDAGMSAAKAKAKGKGVQPPTPSREIKVIKREDVIAALTTQAPATEEGQA